MIIQCDQCNAKFKLDDSKVKEGGAKVRCSKCKHIFVVQRETPAEEADYDSFLNGLGAPPLETPGETGVLTSPTAGQHVAETGEPADTGAFATANTSEALQENDGFDFGEFAFEAGPENDPTATSIGAENTPDSGFAEFDFDRDDSTGSQVVSTDLGQTSFDHDPFPFADDSSQPEPKIGESPGKDVPSFDDDAFFFSDEPVPTVTEIGGTKEHVEEPGVAGEPFFDGMTTASEQEDNTGGAAPSGFSFELEKAESMALSSSPAKEEPRSDSFDIEEFEFGEETSSLKDEVFPQRSDVAGWKESESLTDDHVIIPPASPASIAEDELPPLSISSRRRESSILPIAVTAISVLLVVALAGGGFYFLKEGPAAFDKLGLGFMAKWFGVETKEDGGIAVRNPVASFLKNTTAGEIFVITGEAVNNFTKPRASIQMKAFLYGPKGELLQQKTVYCGNALSREQLTTLPMTELEKATENPFGDSLSNLSVQPGKGIPFVVIFTNVPQGAAEFGVEAAGSTVASK